MANVLLLLFFRTGWGVGFKFTKKYQKTVEPQILLEINQFMSSFLFVLASFLKDLYAQEMLSVYIFLIV